MKKVKDNAQVIDLKSYLHDSKENLVDGLKSTIEIMAIELNSKDRRLKSAQEKSNDLQKQVDEYAEKLGNANLENQQLKLQLAKTRKEVLSAMKSSAWMASDGDELNNLLEKLSETVASHTEIREVIKLFFPDFKGISRICQEKKLKSDEVDQLPFLIMKQIISFGLFGALGRTLERASAKCESKDLLGK